MTKKTPGEIAVYCFIFHNYQGLNPFCISCSEKIQRIYDHEKRIALGLTRN